MKKDSRMIRPVTFGTLAACLISVLSLTARQDPGQPPPQSTTPPAEPSRASAQQPTFRGRSDVVRVFTTVMDRDGRLVTTLGQDDFEVRDDGKPQPITAFDNTPQPIRLIVMLDVSGSMVGNLPLLHAASEQLIGRLRPDDAARVGTFGHQVTISPTFTRDARRLRETLPPMIVQDAPTPLWRAIDDALKAFKGETVSSRDERSDDRANDNRRSDDEDDSAAGRKKTRGEKARDEFDRLAGRTPPSGGTSDPRDRRSPNRPGDSRDREREREEEEARAAKEEADARAARRKAAYEAQAAEVQAAKTQSAQATQGAPAAPADENIRNVILVLSDGKDSGPIGFRDRFVSQAEVIERARAEGVMIYAVGMRSRGNRPPGPQGNGPAALGAMLTADLPDPGLARVAEETGGGYAEIRFGEDLAAAFARVADELHSQYLIGYAPPKRDGKVHDIEVKLLKERGLKPRARKDYVAPKS
jgi:VWFA-related protein